MPTRKNAAYVTEVFSKKDGLYYGQHDGIKHPQIHLVGGNLYLNNQIIPDVKWDKHVAAWHHGTSGTDVSSGLLSFAPDRSWFTGHITQGSLHDKSKRVLAEVRGSVAPSVYNCEVSVNAFDSPETATNAATLSTTKYRTDGVPTISYGVTFDENGKPGWVFQVAGNDWTQDTAQSLDKDYNTVISLIYDSDAVPYLATENNPPYPLTPAAGSFTFHWDGKYLWGYTQIYDQTTLAPSKKYYAFKGILQESVLRTAFTSKLKHTPYRTLAVADDTPLSIDELRGLTASDVALQNRVNELMVIAMKYSMDPKWLSDIFGETQPDISKLPYMQSAVQTDGGKAFYGTSFFNPYLGSGLDALTGPGAPKRKMTDSEKLKVQYFLSVGLANDTNYSTQNQYAYIQAYVDTQVRIKAYLADQATNSDKYYWADQLYAAINTDAVINQLANQIVVNADFALVKRYSLLLQVLGRPEYASQIATAVASNALSKSANNANGASIITSLPDVLQAFITQYNTDPGSSAPKEDISRYEQAQALQQAADFLGSVDNLGKALSDLFVALRNPADSIATTINSVMAKFTANYPKISSIMGLLGKAFMCIAWGAALFSLIQGWANWKTINPLEKTALIARTVQFAGEFALIIPDIGAAIAKGGEIIWQVTDKFLDVIRRIGAWIGSTRVGQIVSDALAYAWETIGGPKFVNWVTSLAEWLSENVFKRIGNIIDATGTLLADLYEWAAPLLKSFLRVLGPLVAAAAAASALYSFIEDLMTGAPTLQTALDGCIAVISVLEVIVAVASLFIESVVLAAVGVILALAAVIIALVEIFDPPPPPPSPEDEFMSDSFYPWLQNQPAPPSDWTPPTAPPSSASSA